jgi:hypothetical protein
MSEKEAIVEQTVEQLELMSNALATLRREHLPREPRTFGILAEGPIEEIGRLRAEIRQILTEMNSVPAQAG